MEQQQYFLKIEQKHLRIPLLNEQYLQDEVQVINQSIELVMNKIINDQKVTGNKISKRDAHPKDHGLITGELKLSEIPKEIANNSLFKDKKYKCLIRFSNSVSLDDRQQGGRGMAVKILGVSGQKHIQIDNINSQQMDLVMINDDKFPTRTSKDFKDLMDSVKDGSKLGIVKWLTAKSILPWNWRFKELQIIKKLNNQSQYDTSLLELNYHSQINYAVNDQYLVRFQFVSLQPKTIRNQDAGADFLKEELVKRISEKEQEFDFRVQVRKIDEVSVKEIEDATVGPDYNRGFVSIGKLIIDQQLYCQQMDKIAENISFNPWRSTFRPLGSVGRVREFVYHQSLRLRRSINNIYIQNEPETLDQMKLVFT